MPFDPNLPAQGSANSSAEMRGQLNGLKALIDAVPTITSAVVDSVNTLPPGSMATVTASLTGGVLHLAFGVPQGQEGQPGEPGSEGQQGPPFASALVISVVTLDPDQDATVSVNFDGSNVLFDFGIPRGVDGNEGPGGPPGEVSTQQLSDAIQDTSMNSNAVEFLNLTLSDPPLTTELQTVVDKMDELINALRR